MDEHQVPKAERRGRCRWLVESLQQGRGKKSQEPRREERRGEGGAGEGKREAARTHHHLHRWQPNFFPPLFFKRKLFLPPRQALPIRTTASCSLPNPPHAPRRRGGGGGKRKKKKRKKSWFSSSPLLLSSRLLAAGEQRAGSAALRAARGTYGALCWGWAACAATCRRDGRRGQRARRGATNLFRKKESKWRFWGCAKFINSALTSRPPRLPAGERWARFGTPPRRAARPPPPPARPRAAPRGPIRTASRGGRLPPGDAPPSPPGARSIPARPSGCPGRGEPPPRGSRRGLPATRPRGSAPRQVTAAAWQLPGTASRLPSPFS